MTTWANSTASAARWLVLSAALTLFVLHAWSFLPFLSDDALISLRYADRLLQGDGLTWTEGAPVEGYSNLLWVLAAALLGALGVDLVEAVRVLGLLCSAAVFVAAWRVRPRADEGIATWLPAAVALLYLASSGTLAAWAVGGLEQPLYAALLATSLASMHRVLRDAPGRGARRALTLSLGLLCWTRPDGPLFTVASVVTLVLVSRLDRRPELLRAAVQVMLVPLLFYAAQTGFRLWYYGELVPNTALVKISASMHHLVLGLQYVADGLLAQAPATVAAFAALLATLRSQRGRAFAVHLLVTLAMWSGYVAFIGGDIFPAYRHFTPIVVLFAFAFAAGVGELLGAARRGGGVALVFAAALAGNAAMQLTDEQNALAREERWEWQAAGLSRVLRENFAADDPLIAVTAAGCLPYWTGFRAVDMLGLNDHYLPRHRPADFGSGEVGHEIGDADYVLERRPDLIVFGIGSEPKFRFGEQLAASEAFRADYAPVRIWVEGDYVPTVYVRQGSERVGVRRTAEQVVVPGYLLRGEMMFAHPADDRRLVATLLATHPARITFDSAADEGWQLTVDSEQREHVRVERTHEGGRTTLVVRVDPAGGVPAADIRSLVLRRD